MSPTLARFLPTVLPGKSYLNMKIEFVFGQFPWQTGSEMDTWMERWRKKGRIPLRCENSSLSENCLGRLMSYWSKSDVLLPA